MIPYFHFSSSFRTSFFHYFFLTQIFLLLVFPLTLSFVLFPFFLRNLRFVFFFFPFVCFFSLTRVALSLNIEGRGIALSEDNFTFCIDYETFLHSYITTQHFKPPLWWFTALILDTAFPTHTGFLISRSHCSWMVNVDIWCTSILDKVYKDEQDACKLSHGCSVQIIIPMRQLCSCVLSSL